MGPCGSGSVADMSQIEAGIFDPWINCDDLDLGTILHQANISNSSSSAGSATSSHSSPISAQSLLSNHANNNISQAQSITDQGESSASKSDNGRSEIQMIDNHGHLQNYGFVCNTNNTNSVSLNPLHNQQQQQQQLQLQHQQQLSSAANSVDSKNFFNIISSAAANAISSHHHHQNHHAHLQQHQHHHHHQQQQQHQHQHQQVSTNNHSHAPTQTSISSSQCSSTVSSVESSPLNNPINSYLSSPTSSSPILITTNATAAGHSLLMIDSEENKQILHQQTLDQHLHDHHNGSGYQQQQQQQQSHNSNNHQRSQQTTNESSTTCDISSDSKSNLESLLHLANGHCEQNRPVVHYEFALNSHNDNNSHLLFACPSQSSSTTAISTNTTSSSNTTSNNSNNSSASRVTSSSPLNNQHHRQSSLVLKSKAHPVIGGPAKPSSTTASLPTSNCNPNNTSSNQIAGQKVRRCRHITDYVLADEEKRLLIKEGYNDFPMTCQSRPLTKTEERILRKIRRKIRNKKSAQCSRQRKKEYVEDLERKYAAIVRENEELKQILDRIQEQRTLVQQTDIGTSNITLDWKDLFITPSK